MKKTYILLLSALPLLFACGGKVKGDQAILDQINKVVANCEVDTRYTFLKNCKENADKDLEKMIKDKGAPLSLPSLAIALDNDDIKVSATSASMLYSHIKDNMKAVNDNPKSVENNVLDLFLKALEKHKSQYYTFYAVRSVTHLAAIKNKTDKLVSFLKTHPEKAVQTEGLNYLMQYGRLSVFSAVKEMGKDANLVTIALYNPQTMYQYNEKETKEICDWTVSFLDNPDDKIAGRASVTTAIRCKGEYLNKLLDKLEKLAGEGKLKGEYRSSLTNFTFGCESFMGSTPSGTPEQCERKKKILETAK
jgi:hypothetical protein